MSAAQRAETLQDSATTCVVGCKLPHGLVLQLRDKDKVREEHTIKGANASRIVGGYGLTHGIPTKFMQEWLQRNAKHPAVLNGNVFMQETGASAESQAKEQRSVESGLEPIDPTKQSRKFGLNPDKASEAAYREQVANNPVRDRQIVE